MALISSADPYISLSRQCELLELPRSSYYYEPVPETEQNLCLMRRLDELHLEHPYYGALRMTAELSTELSPVNVKRVRRLMALMGIRTHYCRPNLSKPCPNHVKYPYLLRGLAIDAPNQVWSTDITYIPMKKGFMYLCAIIDWYSRYLLSWKLSNTLTVGFCQDVLDEAVALYGVPGIMNTDQGSQFTSIEYTTAVKDYKIRHSMDGRGRATDNVMIERFWRSLKYEKIYLYGYETNLALSRGITEYEVFYNYGRKHQGLGERTPAAVYGKAGIIATGSVTALST